MTSTKHINILTVDNGYGLTKDNLIIARVLKSAGFKVSIQTVGKPTLQHKIHRLSSFLHKTASYAFTSRPPYDINLFLEYCFLPWFPYARVNCLIPNQEWFSDVCRTHITKFDYVLCKTEFARDIFDKLNCKTIYISFTSDDRFDENSDKDYDKFFHLAGNDPDQKGTRVLIDVWRKHPEWPNLLIKQKKRKFHVSASNINYINDYLDDLTLRNYQNTRGVHLCLSRAEGFGHSLVEGLSCQSVTVTTNAPPMNEIVTSERGLLVDFSSARAHGLGIHYYVDENRLEERIEEVLGMNYPTKKSLGEKAREWYLENDRFFQERLVEFIASV